MLLCHKNVETVNPPNSSTIYQPVLCWAKVCPEIMSGGEHKHEIDVIRRGSPRHKTAVDNQTPCEFHRPNLGKERFEPLKKARALIGVLKGPESLTNLRQSTIVNTRG